VSTTVKSPPRVVKTRNSETYLDFLPGSAYPKTPSNEVSKRKYFLNPNETSDAYKSFVSRKKLTKK
jgi:hypothetical protein